MAQGNGRGLGEMGGTRETGSLWDPHKQCSPLQSAGVMMGFLKSCALKAVTFTFLLDSGKHKRTCMAVEQKVVLLF